MLESRVKSETSLAKIREGRLKATKQVGRGSPEDIAGASLACIPSSCEQRSEKLPEQSESRRVIFVPVISRTGKVLMPTTPQRARELIRKGKAKKQFRVGIFFLKLLDRKDGDTQRVVVGIDPGSKREAYTVKSKSHTYLNVLSNAITWVKCVVGIRTNMRRNRRLRNAPYRKCRINRTVGGLPPSTKARWQLKLRISSILCKLYPITDFVVEDVKAKSWKNSRKWNENFSPLEAGKAWFYEEIGKLGNLHLKSGWETKELRDAAGLKKTSNKIKEVFTAHNVDSFVLAGWLVEGQVKPDNVSMFKLDPIQFHRRQLHRLQPRSGEVGVRRLYGGTVSLGFKKGSIATHPKHGFCFVGGTMKNRLSLHSVKGPLLSRDARKEDIMILAYNSFKYCQI